LKLSGCEDSAEPAVKNKLFNSGGPRDSPQESFMVFGASLWEMKNFLRQKNAANFVNTFSI